MIEKEEEEEEKTRQQTLLERKHWNLTYAIRIKYTRMNLKHFQLYITCVPGFTLQLSVLSKNETETEWIVVTVKKADCKAKKERRKMTNNQLICTRRIHQKPKCKINVLCACCMLYLSLLIPIDVGVNKMCGTYDWRYAKEWGTHLDHIYKLKCSSFNLVVVLVHFISFVHFINIKQFDEHLTRYQP